MEQNDNEQKCCNVNNDIGAKDIIIWILMIYSTIMTILYIYEYDRNPLNNDFFATLLKLFNS